MYVWVAIYGEHCSLKNEEADTFCISYWILFLFVIYINSTYYRDGSVNVYDSLVSDDHMVSDEHLLLTDENHYGLNSQIKSQKYKL
jgi:hypothetical protein